MQITNRVAIANEKLSDEKTYKHFIANINKSKNKLYNFLKKEKIIKMINEELGDDVISKLMLV